MYERVQADVFLNQMFGMEFDLFAETVIATPIWTLDDFRNGAEKVLAEFRGWYRGITVEYNGKPISVVGTNIGAPLAGDCILAMGHSKNVKNILFSGSAGALNPEYRIGDFVISDESIIGEGFSRYARNIGIDYFGEISHGNGDYAAEIATSAAELVKAKGSHLYSGRLFSTDSILGETKELFDFLEKKGCDAIEMESSAVFTAAFKAKKRACALVLISDLPLRYRNLFEGITLEEKARFDSLRKQIPMMLMEIGTTERG